MEKLLWLYALPYDECYPVVCFDERPCFLIGDVVEPLSMQSAKVAKEHYQYAKNGSCALLAAIEALTGRRQATVYERRTKKEYALFMKALTASYPKARGRSPWYRITGIHTMTVLFMSIFLPKKPLSCPSALNCIIRLNQPVG
jgi:hypothetical protein